MKVKPQTTKDPEASSVGARMLEKIRPRASKLSDEEREALMARGLRMIYEGEAAQKAAPRR